MTVEQLHKILTEIIAQGNGSVPIFFDTEAQTYHYHMAKVDLAFFEEEPEPHLSLHEDCPHHSCSEICKPIKLINSQSFFEEQDYMKDSFEHLMELFKNYNLGTLSYTQTTIMDNKLCFQVYGKRDSIIYYSLCNFGANIIVKAWFGKSYSESGGLRLEADLKNPQHILKLHKRFIASGRRKVLRNAEKW